VYLPQLSLEVFHPNWLDSKVLVICDQHRVCALSGMAQQAGISLGMRRSSVLMLSAQASIKQRDATQELQGLHQVAMSLLQYSPQVSLGHGNTILIDIGASLRLFGGLRRLLKLIKTNLATLGFTAHYGIATNAHAASLLAQKNTITSRRRSTGTSTNICLHAAALTRHLDPLPIELLSTTAPWRDWLRGIGCQRLGELRTLPRAGLQRRCGKALLQSLDAAYGQTKELHQWIEVPTEFQARCELPDRIDNTDTIFHFARALLLQLCGWLSKQHLAVKQIALYLEHERGRQAVVPTILEIQLASATWHEEHLSRLLKERLAQLPLDAPAIGLRLHAPQVEPMQAPNASLFPEPGGNQEDQAQLLELLVARLGPDNVLQAAPHADHRPEVANVWISVLAKQRGNIVLANFHNPRPTWLLPQAIALTVRQHSPHYGSRLTLMSSAERIEAGWWNGKLVTRDYFIAENTAHLRYWIYRERIGHAQQGGDDDDVWYLHGVFG
jgi:protein ImuB